MMDNCVFYPLLKILWDTCENTYLNAYMESSSILGRKNTQSTSCTKRKRLSQDDNSGLYRRLVTKNVLQYVFCTPDLDDKGK